VDLSKQQAGSKIVYSVTAADGGDLPLTGSAVIEVTILSITASNVTEIITYTTEHSSTASTADTSISTSTSPSTTPITTFSEVTTNLQMSQKDQSSGNVNVTIIVGSVLLSLAVVMICISIGIWCCFKRKPVVKGRNFVLCWINRLSILNQIFQK